MNLGDINGPESDYKGNRSAKKLIAVSVLDTGRSAETNFATSMMYGTLNGQASFDKLEPV